ncbi:leucine-rich repeat-containing protein 20-like [Mya arenaria]|uniref:leucine-rich repeat-containing protein 20-like n=1 Tax=Mya arenaria TaxID=6604 RepID=UPI0022DFD165|nr:leucine-rich repeat-containing protein 20-like [Mya arenaria]
MDVCKKLQSKQRAMAAEVARVARRVEEAKETKHLDLSNCELRMIPDAIYFMLKDVELTTCDLSKNSLKKIPPKFCTKFPSITGIDIQQNLIVSLPDEMKELTELTRLDVSNNKLETFPEQICDCPKLQLVSLRENRMSDLNITKVQSMPALKGLDVQDNPLSPETVSKLAGIDQPSVLFGVSDPAGKELEQLE